jgi:hypothetical protein
MAYTSSPGSRVLKVNSSDEPGSVVVLVVEVLLVEVLLVVELVEEVVAVTGLVEEVVAVVAGATVVVGDPPPPSQS